MSHADKDYTIALMKQPKYNKKKKSKSSKVSKVTDLIDKQTHESLDYKEFVSFIPSLLSVVTFPHKKSSRLVKTFTNQESGRSIQYYVRHYKYSNGTTAILEVLSMHGIPYGVIPRRILAYITKQVKLTDSKIIFLGNNQKEFLEKILGDSSTGGANIKRLKEQLKSIFTCSINLETKSVHHVSETESEIIDRIEKINLIDSSTTIEKMWTIDKESQWETNIVISDRFFEIIKKRSLPIDERVLLALDSPMAIDIYQYFLYQNATLSNNPHVQINEADTTYSSKIMHYNWEFLKELFGFGWSSDRYAMRDFKIEFKKQLQAVLAVSKLQIEAIGDNAKDGYRLLTDRNAGVITMKEETETLHTRRDS
jgi:hypothetical protein